jgi:hypothetical protein
MPHDDERILVSPSCGNAVFEKVFVESVVVDARSKDLTGDSSQTSGYAPPTRPTQEMNDTSDLKAHTCKLYLQR